MTDAYLDDGQVLIEAKSGVSRELVRTAIGQLYDYKFQLDMNVDLALLVPRALPCDLAALMEWLGIAVIWKSGNGFLSTDPRLVAQPK